MKANNIVLHIKRADGTEEYIEGKNIVTYEGDIYYAQKIAGQATDFSSPYLRLGYNSTQVPSKNDTDVIDLVPNSTKAIDASTYPERNNQDAGNPLGGEAVLTWKIVYDLGDLDAVDIAEAAIVNDSSAPTKAICRFLFERKFAVTPTDALTVYVNHALVGV